jgi:hypothetical protein
MGTSGAHWLRVNNVAKACCVSERTVRSWAESGLLKGQKLGPKLWFFEKAEVQHFLERGLADNAGGSFASVCSVIEPRYSRFHHGALLVSQVFLTPSPRFATPWKCELKATVVGSVQTNTSTYDITDAYTFCFLTLCRGLCDYWQQSSTQTNSVVDFIAGRTSPAMIGIAKGYEQLWRRYASSCPYEIGDLRSTAEVPAYELYKSDLLDLVQSCSPESSSNTRFQGSLNGLPVYGYHLISPDVTHGVAASRNAQQIWPR